MREADDEEMDSLIASLAELNVAVLAKLDGLDEYDLRRPLTPTGSNLLGIVKHLASVQTGYFADTFGGSPGEPLRWFSAEAEVNADMFATADEASEWVRDFYRRSWTAALEAFSVTALDDTGTVPWWPPDRRHPTLRTVLIHMTIETARHAGHLDILREMIDGSAGRFANDPSIPTADEIDWPSYVARVGDVARAASGRDDTHR